MGKAAGCWHYILCALVFHAVCVGIPRSALAFHAVCTLAFHAVCGGIRCSVRYIFRQNAYYNMFIFNPYDTAYTFIFYTSQSAM